MRYKLHQTKYPGVFRREGDGRFVLRIKVVSDKTGKPVDASRTLAPDATLAKARLAVEKLREDARSAEKTIRPPSLLVYAAEWISRKVSRGDWAAGGSTQESVERIFRLHVPAWLGDTYLDRIRPPDLEKWMDTQVATGDKPTSIHTRWGWLKRCVRAGCHEYGLPDPTHAARPPKGGTRKGGEDLVLLPDQVATLLSYAQEQSPDVWFLVLLLGFASGARPGEVLAVKVGDLDLSGETGKWTAQRHWTPRGIAPGLKTGPDDRIIYLPPQATGYLRARTEGMEPGAYVFAGGRAGVAGVSPSTCLTVQGLWTWLRRTCDRLGLPRISGKTFRQTYATLASLSGVATVITMAQLGHSTERTHDIYRRVPEQVRREAAEGMADIIPLAGRKVGT